MTRLQSLVATSRAAAGTLALAAGLVGLAEGALVWAYASLAPGEGPALLLYAFGLHAAFGAVGGLVAGAVLWPLTRGARWTPERLARWLGAAALAVGAGAVGTFHLVRDGDVGTVAAAGLAFAGSLLVAAAFLLALRPLLRAAPTVAPAAIVLLGLGAVVFGQRALEGTPAPGRDAPGAASADKPNVILVVVDTLRADLTGPYGGQGPDGASLTPNLDRFAAGAVRFRRMYSNATWTRPAVTSILSGRLPSGHGVMAKASALPPELPTIATAFHDGGYATAGTVTNVNLAPDFGFGRGFDAYRYHGPSRPFGATGPAVRLSLVNVARLVQERLSSALVTDRFYADGEKVADDADALLGGLKDGPFFLWVHFMDPHDPFLHHPLDGTGVARVRTPHPAPERADEMRALYQGEVRHWDAAFGRFLDHLEARGLLANTVVAVTADHGEEFQDHGGFWHGQTLFEELTRVPLLVHLPGGARGGEVDGRLAAQVDVAPTLLGLAGLPVPDGMVGSNLLAQEESADELRTVVIEEDHEGMRLTGLVWENYKYVRANEGNWRGLPVEALYDLAADPKEHHNLAGEDPDRTAEVAALLEQRLEGEAVTPYGGEKARSVPVDGALEEDLRSLGYVQ